MVIIDYLIVWCCFNRKRGQSESFLLAWGRTRDARRPTPRTRLYTAPFGSQRHNFANLKDDGENVSKHGLWSSPIPFSNRSQKKGGPWTQKGKRSHGFIISHVLTNQCNAWRRNPNYDVFFSDYEASDGKKKARSYQLQPEPFEKPHPSPHRQRCKLLRFSLNWQPFPCLLKSRQPTSSWA